MEEPSVGLIQLTGDEGAPVGFFFPIQKFLVHNFIQFFNGTNAHFGLHCIRIETELIRSGDYVQADQIGVISSVPVIAA